MADNDKRKFDLPWGTLLPLMAVLAGVVAQYKPLVSERPSVASEKTTPVIAAQDVDARLWQDPIGVAQKEKSLLNQQAAGPAKEASAKLHDISALTALLDQNVKAFSKNAPVPVLLLAVMLDAGPYSEQAESRLRARHAVLEGLSESGFMPIDGEHIGFVTATWPPPEAKVPSLPVKEALLLPWEECEAIDDRERVYPRDTKRVVVVWLPAANFNFNPLRCLACLIDQLAPEDIRDKIRVRLIGPANSTGLQTMVKEACWDQLTPLKDEASVTMQRALDGVSIISTWATASDLTLLSRGVSDECAKKSVETILEEFITRDSGDGLHFVRTIAPDDWVLDKLIQELARRRIATIPQVNQDGHPISKPAHIVILSEWDTLYGRSLGTTFAAKASAQKANDISEHSEARRARIDVYHYLRGIDGRLPGDAIQ